MGEQGEDALAEALAGDFSDIRSVEILHTNPVPINTSHGELQHPDRQMHGDCAILDACDGEGLMVSPKDPSTFYLDDEDDGPAIGLGNSFENTNYLDIDANEYAQDGFISHSREFSGGFPPIPEDSEFGPSGSPSRDDFGREQLSMAHMPFLAAHDDFSVGFNAQQMMKDEPRRIAKGFHKVASMPNFSLGLTNSSVEEDGDHDQETHGHLLPKSFSTNDLSSLSAPKYDVPHSQFLTAPHMRKGKGGRQPKMDPRMDPNIDPKKARRILANRLSAAKSKLKQKTAMEKLKQRIQSLEAKKESLQEEITTIQLKCKEQEETRSRLQNMLKHLRTNK